ncbi:hypothetical protein Salat_2578100 [Sesamum alatum]|uniref:Uncharacterized protein n=1 Tax=Sesamum alatum TaxID=300844 RepID=A0AAE1XMP3_9LAMI|nr:hypothetical protein Salat_2578100 [Sesamum alatum]
MEDGKMMMAPSGASSSTAANPVGQVVENPNYEVSQDSLYKSDSCAHPIKPIQKDKLRNGVDSRILPRGLSLLKGRKSHRMSSSSIRKQALAMASVVNNVSQLTQSLNLANRFLV